MPFLSRRSLDPLTFISSSRDKSGYPHKQSVSSLNPRLRSRSEASVFRRVSTLFAARRRTLPSKASFSQTDSSSGSLGVEFSPPSLWSPLPRASSDSTSDSSLEIRRPSGLGRRASLLGYPESIDSEEDFGKPLDGLGGDTTPTIAFASLPNLLGDDAYHLHQLPQPEIAHPPQPPLLAPCYTASFVLPDPLFRAVLEFLPRGDLPAVALVSRGFCSAARYALYHALDMQNTRASSRVRLERVLASRKDLAALVVSFYCHTSVPSRSVRQAFQNMYNLKSLTLPSFVSMLSLTPSFTFALTHLTVLDKRMTQSQLVALRSWLATQPTLESLSFPRLVEYTGSESSPVSDPHSHAPFPAFLPRLKSLHAFAEIVSPLCVAIKNPIQHLKLEVHTTLYTGLRPGAVIRSLSGVRDMHIVFAPEVDKRTVEKFLAVTGTTLTGENKPGAMKSLEVEVLWTDNDAAETLYGIVTSIISRFRGLESLKLTSPFRPIQAPILGPVSVPLIRPPTGSPCPSPPQTDPALPTPPSTRMTPPAALVDTVRKEFVACGVEQGYAKTWTRYCPSLSDIQFDFSCSATDAEVELCGMWFRRKIPLFPQMAAAT